MLVLYDAKEEEPLNTFRYKAFRKSVVRSKSQVKLDSLHPHLQQLFNIFMCILSASTVERKCIATHSLGMEVKTK